MSNLTKVTFTVRAKTRPGESVILCGDCMALGSFSVKQAIAMSTTPETYPVWKTTRPVAIPRGFPVKYRYAVSARDRISYWEKVADRTLVPKGPRGKTLDVFGQVSGKPRSTDTRHAAMRSSGVPPPPMPDLSAAGAGASFMPPASAAGTSATPPHGDGAHVARASSAIPVFPTTATASSGSAAASTADPPFVPSTPPLSAAVSALRSELSVRTTATPPRTAGSTAAAAAAAAAATADSSDPVDPSDPSAAPPAIPSPDDICRSYLKGHKLILVSYDLPITLRRVPSPPLAAPGGSPSPDADPSSSSSSSSSTSASTASGGSTKPTATTRAHTWVAEWDADNFIGKSAESSIADAVETVWVGCVTGNCVDRGSAPAASTRTPTGTPYEFSEDDQADITAALNEMGVRPLFVPSSQQLEFGLFCSTVLKPALHNVVEANLRSELSLERQAAGWKAFNALNSFVAEAVARLFRPGDVVWTHGFELVVFPRLFAELHPVSGQIFFLNAPFPTSEVFRTLSVRSLVLEGILAADVVGFHTFNHARHFMQTCKRIVGLNFQSRKGGRLGVEYNGRDVMVAVSHVGIPAHAARRQMTSQETLDTVKSIRALYPDQVLMTCFADSDRLSGVCPLMLAIEHLLTEHPGYRKTVTTLVHVEVPSCEAMSRQSGRAWEENRALVARINKAFPGAVDYRESVAFSSAYRYGVYYTADILLHAPLHQGLCLLPMEYVFSRFEWLRQSMSEAEADKLSGGTRSPAIRPQRTPVNDLDTQQAISAEIEHLSKVDEAAPPADSASDSDDDVVDTSLSDLALSTFYVPSYPAELETSLPPLKRAGVVVLSEFATASHVMNSHLLINPWHVAGVASTISTALRMDDHERGARQGRDYQFICRNHAASWSLQIVADLLAQRATSGAGAFTEVEHSHLVLHSRTVQVGSTSTEGELSPLDISAAVRSYRSASKRVLFFDYGGTLVPIEGVGLYVKTRFQDEEPGGRGMGSRVLAALSRLAQDPATTVCIVSGISVDTFELLPVAADSSIVLGAENGRMVSTGLDPVTKNRVWRLNEAVEVELPDEWEEVRLRARMIMEQYRSRVTGSAITSGPAYITWSFRHADPEWGDTQAGFLHKQLSESVASTPWVTVTMSRSGVTVAVGDVTKGSFVCDVLTKLGNDADFVLALGDDTNDEEMFIVLHALLSESVDSFMSPAMAAPTPIMSTLMSPLADGFMLDDLSTPDDYAAASTHHMRKRSVGVVTVVDGEAQQEGSILTHHQDIAALPSLRTVVTCTVGRKRSNARYFVRQVEAVERLVESLAVHAAPLPVLPTEVASCPTPTPASAPVAPL